MNKRIGFKELYHDISNHLLTCDTESMSYESDPLMFIVSFVNQNKKEDITLSLFPTGTEYVHSKTGRKSKVVCYDFLQSDISRSKKVENDIRTRCFELVDIVQSRMNLGDFKDNLRCCEFIDENLYVLKYRYEHETNLELKHDLRRLIEAYDEFGKQRKVTIGMLKEEEMYLKKHSSFLIQSSDSIVVSGHNFMTYDVDQLRTSSKDNVFTPGIDNSSPMMRSLIKDISKRASVRGLQIVDSLGLSRYYCPFSKNSLSFLVGALRKELGLGHIVKVKDIDYAQLIDNADASQLGNLESSFENVTYAYNDTCEGDRLTRFFLEPLLIASYAFDKDLEIVSSSSPYSLAVKLRDLNNLEDLNTTRSKFVTKDMSNPKVFDFGKVKKRALRTGKVRVEQTTSSLIDFDIKKGLFSDVHVFYLPIFPTAFRDEFSKDKHMGFVYDHQRYLDHPLKRYMAFSCIEAFAKELLFDLSVKKNNPNPKNNQPDVVFRQKYGVKVSDEERRKIMRHFKDSDRVEIVRNLSSLKLEHKLYETVEYFSKILRNTDVINFSDRFFFFRTENREIISELYKQGVYFGKGNVFSVGRGRVKTDINDLSCGINIFSKYKRCDFEIGTLGGFMDVALKDGRDAALNYLGERCSSLVNFKIPRKDLLLNVTCMKDSDFVDEDRQEQEWQKIISHFYLRESESIKFGFVDTEDQYEKDDMFRLALSPVDINKYLSKFFGPSSRTGREFSKGTIGKIASALISRRHSDRSYLDDLVSGRNIQTSLF